VEYRGLSVFKLKHLVLALAALPVAGAASAATLDLVGDFGNPAFQYGGGDFSAATPSFTAFTHHYNSCFDVSGLNCITSGPSGAVSGSSNLPGIGLGSGALHFLTVDVPAGELWTHPGNSAGTDAVIQFTATSIGTYTLNGLFQRLDDMTSGSNDPGNNGVDVAIYKTSGGVTSLVWSSGALAGTGVLQNKTAGYGFDVSLLGGDTLSWVVANNGNYYNDSTGVKGTITFAEDGDDSIAVPEPASWALMLGGFGLVGGALRTNRKRAVSFG
jgi:hypothetical protein